MGRTGGLGSVPRLSFDASNQPELAGETGTQPDAFAALPNTNLLIGRRQSPAGLASGPGRIRDRRGLNSGRCRRWSGIANRLKRNHQGGPVIGPLGAATTGTARTKGNPNHIGSFN